MKLELRTFQQILRMGVLVMIGIAIGREALATTPSKSQLHCGGDDHKCETLEVLSLGVTYDKFRQGNLWNAIRSGTAFAPLREFDESIEPWSKFEKMGRSKKRAADAFENAVAVTPMYWGMPSMYASVPYPASRSDDANRTFLGLTGSAEVNGFSWHLFVASTTLLSSTPDRLVETAFQFFDDHPDVPLLFVSAVDSPYIHDSRAVPSTLRNLRDGRYVVQLPDSAVVFVFGRRERVDRLRNFAWEDKDNDFGQNKIRMAYYELRGQLAKPDTYNNRHLSVEEWQAESARLAARNDIRSGWGTSRLRNGWTPSPWFPVPWSTSQLAAFDRLPTLGYVHRPVFVKWEDAEGKPADSEEQRILLMKRGLDEARQALSANGKSEFPTRIIAATENRVERSLILHKALNAQKAEGGPGYEITNKTKFIDTDRRLGNTGSATFFMQAAIGIMGSYREGGVSAAINMRDPNGASIMLISPPSDELRAKQQHPSGGDVFRHKVEPAYDPEVYKQ